MVTLREKHNAEERVLRLEGRFDTSFECRRMAEYKTFMLTVHDELVSIKTQQDSTIELFNFPRKNDRTTLKKFIFHLLSFRFDPFQGNVSSSGDFEKINENKIGTNIILDAKGKKRKRRLSMATIQNTRQF